MLLCVPVWFAAVPDLCKTAAANISHRDNSQRWPLDLALPPAKSVCCLHVPAELFLFRPFCKKEIITAPAVEKIFLEIIYLLSVLPQEGRS